MSACVTIKRSHEFGRVMRQGRSARRRTVMVHRLEKKCQPCTRVGVTVSRKIPTAVARNRLKRLLREAWRSYSAEVAPGSDVVLTATQAALGESYWRIRREVGSCLGELGLLPARDPAAPKP